METEITTPETGMVKVAVESGEIQAQFTVPEDKVPGMVMYFENMASNLPLEIGEEIQELANDIQRHVNHG